MALSDCSKCWDTPCICGHNYKHLSVHDLKDLIGALEKILKEKEANGEIKPIPEKYTFSKLYQELPE